MITGAQIPIVIKKSFSKNISCLLSLSCKKNEIQEKKIDKISDIRSPLYGWLE